MKRIVSALAVGMLVACAPFGWDPASASASASPNSPDSCSFDSECISRNCSFGSCSPFSKPDDCAVDAQCPGGSCQAGSCSPIPASTSCAVDAQCPGGSCQFGSCSPIPAGV